MPGAAVLGRAAGPDRCYAGRGGRRTRRPRARCSLSRIGGRERRRARPAPPRPGRGPPTTRSSPARAGHRTRHRRRGHLAGPADPARRARDCPPCRPARTPPAWPAARRSASSSAPSAGETVVGLAAADERRAGLALGTAGGVVKRVAPDYPGSATDFEVIALKDGDRVVGAVQLASEDAGPGVHHQRRPAAAVRRRGGPAAGPGGRRDGRASGWRRGPAVVWFGAVPDRCGGTARSGRPRTGRSWSPWPVQRGAARHRGGHGQGDPVRGVPGQGPGHRRRALPPVPQGRGRAGAGLGRAGPGPGRHRRRASRSTCPPPTGRRDGSGERIRQPLAALGGSAPARLRPGR